LASTAAVACAIARKGQGKASSALPSTDKPSATHAAWCNWWPASCIWFAPKNWPTIGPAATTTPMKPMNTVM
jgi:hypothetical protein